jgi:DNA-binding response OmpR family regulator
VWLDASNVNDGGLAAIRGSAMRRGFLVQSKGYIFIVEPDELLRGLLERWLSEAGYAVASTKDRAAAGVLPQLVIADISDPASAGTTIEALQAEYAAPILALSARFRRGLGGSSEPAKRLRVGKVLPKPFTREELLRAVRDTVKEQGVP